VILVIPLGRQFSIPHHLSKVLHVILPVAVPLSDFCEIFTNFNTLALPLQVGADALAEA
jgi:hypothetical protein